MNILETLPLIVLTALITAFFASIIPRKLQERQRRNVAAITFKNKVLAELKGLYPVPSNWPDDSQVLDAILRRAFPNLQAAVIEYRQFLPKRRQRILDKAWYAYRLGDSAERNGQNYFQYWKFGSNPNYREDFKHNVDKLLECAKIYI
jgi:hypothetical protein